MSKIVNAMNRKTLSAMWISTVILYVLIGIIDEAANTFISDILPLVVILMFTTLICEIIITKKALPAIEQKEENDAIKAFEMEE